MSTYILRERNVFGYAPEIARTEAMMAEDAVAYFEILVEERVQRFGSTGDVRGYSIERVRDRGPNDDIADYNASGQRCTHVSGSYA